MPGIKVQRVDFSASDWLGGTSTLSLQECGLYIKICALIYLAGGPVTKADVRKIVPSCRYQTLTSLLTRLIEKGKITFDGKSIDQPRCERELARARRRIAEARGVPVDNSASPVDNSAAMNEMEVPFRIQSVGRTVPEVLNQINEVADPHARAKGNQREKEDSKNLKGDLGRCAPARVRAHKGSVDEMVAQVTATLCGHVPKAGIRDPVAYRAAVKESKYRHLMRQVNNWVGCHLDGAARLAGWELMAIATAEGVHGRDDLAPAVRKAIDRLIAMYRVTQPLAEAAE